MRTRRRLLSSAAAATLVAAGLASVAAPGSAAASTWTSCRHGSTDRQQVFTRAAQVSGVPRSVLLAVGYMESRWDDHGARPSTAGGYGPMHLLDPSLGGSDPRTALRGESADTGTGVARGPLQVAASLTGYSTRSLRGDDVANICGGAALLASYQHALAAHHVTARAPRAWTPAIARYSGAADRATAGRFVAQVFSVLRSGQSRTTNDGQQVRLAAHPSAAPDRAALGSMGLVATHASGQVECPQGLGCEWVPAPYKWYDHSTPSGYGNHDLADRPSTMKIRYIVIHDTEASWDTTLNLVQDPTYVSWQYTIRSSDGLVAQHVPLHDVAWHAGNWYVNMHSIGIEHEGYGDNGSWYTESMYQSSADLVRFLANKYGVPLDRAHIIGHDQVPGIDPAHVAGMHWDPGPYWDWQHYFDLLGAPIAAPHTSRAPADTQPQIVTVAPGFAGNANPVTGCTHGPCETGSTNFVYLHTQPSTSAPLVKDVGLHPDGSYSTTDVSDIGARVSAGQKLVVAKRSGEWLGVWYLGELGWLDDPPAHPTVVPGTGQLVRATRTQGAPVYGRAYPERSAYPSQIPYQNVTPLQYTLKAGQAYVLADGSVPTDYYYATTYNCAYAALDCTDVKGQDRYYQIWFGHRQAFVRAADVRVGSVS